MVDITLPELGADHDTWGGVLNTALADLQSAINALHKGDFSTASTSTLTVDVDDYRAAEVTALAATMTIAAPTGTPENFQGLLFRIKDDGTARTLIWNEAFVPIGVTLPTTTVTGLLLYVMAVWNPGDGQWDVLSVGVE